MIFKIYKIKNKNKSIHFWRWWSDFFWIVKIPKLVFASVVIPLKDLGSVFLTGTRNIHNFSTKSINDVIFFVFFLIDSESLFWIVAFWSKVKFSSIGITFNCQVVTSLFAFNEPVRALLNKSETLIVTAPSFPEHSASFKWSILSKIQDLSTMDRSEWVVKLGVFTWLILLFFEQTENHFLEIS